ncbi:MAG: hypothetical protein JJ934_05135 [Pseudomonadales bacterium]|nr:hypothetical protein [Pseudomonadales bacterium]
MFNADELSEFQRTTWGRQPKVFRQAIDVTAFPISTSQLAELTGDELVESRMITGELELVHGPFESDGDTSAHLPANTMLMIQCLEQHLQVARDLVNRKFSFLPSWQLDDVMASYGNDGANCGAHFDKYDVFLVQHTGHKVWHLDNGGHHESDLEDNADVRLLAAFSPTTTVVTEPGDVLYVPPGFGHHGICEGDSITLSVGIRNPTIAELLADLSEFAMYAMETNPTMTSQLFANEYNIDGDVISQIAGSMNDVINLDLLRSWFGSYSSRLRAPELLSRYALDPPPDLTPGVVLLATLPSRFTSAEHTLFANGEFFTLEPSDQEWIKKLISDREFTLGTDVSTAGLQCLEQLLSSGALQVR